MLRGTGVGEREVASAAEGLNRARRVCFFAHYDVDDAVDDYVLHYLRSLGAAGFIVVVATTSRLNAVERGKLDGLAVDVLLRENRGLDFGGWADCLARYPDIAPDLLLLCNDSVYGPFWDLGAFVDDLTARPADAYGALLSVGESPHLQSWFLLLRPAAYRSAPFAELFGAPVPAHLSKPEIIDRYEKRFTGMLEDEGLTVRAAFDPREQGPLRARVPMNAAFVLWDEMLTRRIQPFLKIQAIRDRKLWRVETRAWTRVAARLDPDLTEAARANLVRREARASSSRFGGVREFLYLLTLDSVFLPPVRAVVVREAAAFREGRLVRARLYRGAFYAMDAAHRLVRLPYALVYRAIGRRRTRATG